MLDKYLAWFKSHERLLLVALVLLVGHYGVKHYLDNAATSDKTKADVAVAALMSQKAIDAQLATETAQVTAQYQTMVTQLTQQNAELAKAVSSRNTALQAQKGTDAQLPLSGLALRLESLGNAPVNSISVDQNSIILTQPGAVAVTQTLEEVPVLRANLKDTQQLADNTGKELAQSGKVISSLNAQVSGLTLAGMDADKACKAEVASVKADARKSKLSWFKRGLLVGFLGGLYLGHVAL